MCDTSSSDAKELYYMRGSKSKAEIRKKTHFWLISSVAFRHLLPPIIWTSMSQIWFPPPWNPSSSANIICFSLKLPKQRLKKSRHFQISLTDCEGKEHIFPYLIRRPWNFFIMVQYEYLWVRSAQLNVNRTHIRKKGSFFSAETSK